MFWFSKIKSRGEYWVDRNGNKWRKSKHSKAEAEKLSESLVNCTDCIECENCKHCTDCIDCYDCTHCHNCYRCGNCSYSKQCEWCNNCDYCEVNEQCSDCSFTEWGGYCTDLEFCCYCMHTKHGKHLRFVDSSVNVAYQHNIEQSENSKE